MSDPRETIDGYVADSLYPSNFHQAFTPPWTDAILVHRGLKPPRDPRRAFTLYDLGCGDGLGLILQAAAHPEAHFVGIDAMPGHIARGKSLISELGLHNIELKCATFQQALAGEGRDVADYAACQGVLAWVSLENRLGLLDLAAQLLRPGGILTIGYNCFPGWGHIAPFQRAVRALAEHQSGGPAARFDAAFDAARGIGLIAPSTWRWFDKLRNTLPRDYFAHEYLNGHWGPLWAEDTIAMCAARGLNFLSEAGAHRLRPDFAYKARWRTLFDQVAATGARENLIDVATGNWFRTDIHVKAAPVRLEEETMWAMRLDGWWAARTPAKTAKFTARTSAGTIRFANDAARAIMAHLDRGPAPLSSISGIDAADLLNTIDALFVAGSVAPVDPPASTPDAMRTNARLFAEKAPINGIASRHGAIELRGRGAGKADATARRRLGIADVVPS